MAFRLVYQSADQRHRRQLGCRSLRQAHPVRSNLPRHKISGSYPTTLDVAPHREEIFADQKDIARPHNFYPGPEEIQSRGAYNFHRFPENRYARSGGSLTKNSSATPKKISALPEKVAVPSLRSSLDLNVFKNESIPSPFEQEAQRQKKALRARGWIQ